ncbi:MAG: universal stress protein [Dehalobacterium sp.]
MFKKIMVAIDGSEHSLKAIDASIEIAKKSNGKVEVIHVIPVVKQYVRDYARVTPTLEKSLEEEANKIMKETTEKFNNTGIEHNISIKKGDAADVIICEAEEKVIELIVMGSRGLGAISKFVLGSVSSKVLSHAHCSVLIIR